MKVMGVAIGIVAIIIFVIIFAMILAMVRPHKMIKDGMDDLFKMEGEIFKRATQMREQFGSDVIIPNTTPKPTICEYCGASVPADATSCPKCGARIKK